MAQTKTTQEGHARSDFMKALSTLKTTWPLVLALAFNRCSAIYGSYGSYASTDAGLATDGGTLLGLAVLLIPLILIGFEKLSFTEKQSDRLLYICVALQVFCLIAITATYFFSAPGPLMLCLHSLNGILEILAGGCWLRKFKGVPTSISMLALFGALILSEVLFWPGYFFDNLGDGTVACAITASQMLLVPIANAHSKDMKRITRSYEIDHSESMGSEVNRGRFLVMNGVCLGLLSMVIGFLRGFPNGEPIVLDLPSRVGYFVAVVALCLFCCWFALHRKRQAGISDMWITTQILACVTMVLYAAFPDNLAIGGAGATVTNALCVVYIWLLTVEFMSYGNKDPMYYQIGGRIVFMGGRAISRMAEGFLTNVFGMTSLLMFSISSTLLIGSTTILVYILLREEQSGHDVPQAASPQPHRLRTLMGVNIDDESTLTDMREASTRRQVEQIGRQFMLSRREVEVLTLWAMGFKQQSVADQLGISSGTVHAHIKRIYSKTNMHSRQDVLDYIDKYCT